MRINFYTAILILSALALLPGLTFQENYTWSMDNMAPENYDYTFANKCLNCKMPDTDFMARAVGVEISSGMVKATGDGWMQSAHARSLDHDEEMNTFCAACHFPTLPQATTDKEAGKPFEKSGMHGVSCFACHSSGMELKLRKSAHINFEPGSDPTVPESYTFIYKSDKSQSIQQCCYCHKKNHGFTSSLKQEMLESAEIRCIDCHMAGYAVNTFNQVERHHDMKVAKHAPLSCSASFDSGAGCHDDATTEWIDANLPNLITKDTK